MNSQIITSFSNERVKLVQKLRNKKDREKEGLFVIEGYRELQRALLSNRIRFHSLFFSPDCFLGENEFSLISKFQCKLFQLPQKVFEKISYRDRPDGLLALAYTPDFTITEDTIIPEGDLFLIIEGVEKPGNLGTILRTSEGAGVNAVFVSDSRLDIFNPNVVRASTGTLFTIPIFIGSILEILEKLNNLRIPVFALSPEAKDSYFKENFKTKTAFIFGSEQYGLSREAKLNSQKLISIPMKGEADSLNLAMSCGILLYEVLRQRSI